MSSSSRKPAVMPLQMPPKPGRPAGLSPPANSKKKNARRALQQQVLSYLEARRAAGP